MSADVKTHYYPAYPTDMADAQMVAGLTTCIGTGMITENGVREPLHARSWAAERDWR